ncbi:MAG: hypothetical protein GY793_03845 [Proteobacteria bacterium]|nr:hypothetical protein [Pseudomonadota bacterium]
MKLRISKKLFFVVFTMMFSVFLSTLTIAGDKSVSKNNLNGFQITGPYAYENLSLFLIQGKDSFSANEFITLKEALDTKVAVLHETSNVNNLSIENLSSDKHIYIQSGDIVKGGKQDRAISIDIVIKPKSGKIPLSAFCVEKGRWTSRGNEAVNKFSSSNDSLSSKKLKLAAKSRKSQNEVWKEVASTQKNLKQKIGRNVKSGKSESSLQLTLENKALKKIVSDYMKELSPIINKHKNTVGYAFAINGEFNSSDIYGSGKLFKKLWPKLLKASVVEAIAAREKGKNSPKAKLKDIELSLKDALNGKKSEKKVGQGTKIITHESDKNVLFDTYDKGSKSKQPVHRNIIKK